MTRSRPSNRSFVRCAIPGALAVFFVAAPSLAQDADLTIRGNPQPAASPEPDPVVEAFKEMQRRAKPLERELRIIRAKYIRGIRNVEIRQAGIHKLREFTDPASFPLMLDIFRNDEDVRLALMRHLSDMKTEEADATLAWTAVYDESKAVRQVASDTLTERFAKEEVSMGVQTVVAQGLRSSKDSVLSASASLAQVLKLYEAIPMMINAQIGGGGTSARVGGGGDGALAYILVGKQQTFVSDLTPVVGDSAVAFDPTLSVLTEGVILRVIDAVVLTYRVEVHRALVGLSSAGWGQPTDDLGWDQRKWHEWAKAELPAIIARRDAKLQETAAKATAHPAAPNGQAAANPAPTKPPPG